MADVKRVYTFGNKEAEGNGKMRELLGGKGADLVHFFNEDGLGAIVNSSRGIIAAYKQEAYASFGELNYADASRKAVEVMIEDISGALNNR